MSYQGLPSPAARGFSCFASCGGSLAVSPACPGFLGCGCALPGVLVLFLCNSCIDVEVLRPLPSATPSPSATPRCALLPPFQLA
jgi:hypothetical protein